MHDHSLLRYALPIGDLDLRSTNPRCFPAVYLPNSKSEVRLNDGRSPPTFVSAGVFIILLELLHDIFLCDVYFSSGLAQLVPF
jgi:hypothetical protein